MRPASDDQRRSRRADAKHELSVASVLTTPEGYDRVVATLVALPATQLTSLAIELTKRGGIDARQRAAMTAAARRQTRLTGFRA